MSPLPRWALGPLLVASWACSTQESTPASSAAAAAAIAEREGTGAIAAVCQSSDTIDPQLAKALGTQATEVYQALRSGDHDGLWALLHPQARRDDQRDAFMKALSAMRGRLEPAPGGAQVDRVHLVEMSGGANTLAQVLCGAPDDPDRFTLLANAGGEDVAVISLRSGTPTARYATTVQLRRRGDRWRLLSIHVSPSHYRGKDAAAYEQLADLHMKQQRVVVGHVLLALAGILSDRGASVQSALHERVTQKVAAIERDQLFQAETGTWTLGDARFRIQNLSLVATINDISPVFEYVSPQGLVKDLLDRDADMLVAEVQRRFPELSQHFDAVVFEAYTEAPDQPSRSYQAFRVVRYLDPARRRG